MTLECQEQWGQEQTITGYHKNLISNQLKGSKINCNITKLISVVFLVKVNLSTGYTVLTKKSLAGNLLKLQIISTGREIVGAFHM